MFCRKECLDLTMETYHTKNIHETWEHWHHLHNAPVHHSSMNFLHVKMPSLRYNKFWMMPMFPRGFINIFACGSSSFEKVVIPICIPNPSWIGGIKLNFWRISGFFLKDIKTRTAQHLHWLNWHIVKVDVNIKMLEYSYLGFILLCNCICLFLDISF